MVDELYSVYILAICCQSIISCNGELNENSVVRFYRTTAVDGKQYDVAHYNLDMVLALGYRVRSQAGVRFRNGPVTS